MISELLREFLFPTSSVTVDSNTTNNGNISPKYSNEILAVIQLKIFCKRHT